MKICTKCKVEKELTEFSKNKNYKDGFQNQCKSCAKARMKAYYEDNRDKISAHHKDYYKDNKDKAKAYRKAYYKDNKDKARAYEEANRDKINARERERRKTDSLYKMKGNLRNRTSAAFKNKGYSKTSKTQEILGIDWKTVKAHIEKQFTKGMCWDNYGEWHIDHIMPLASANTIEETIKLCHYTNLQPLWALDNIKKGDKIL